MEYRLNASSSKKIVAKYIDWTLLMVQVLLLKSFRTSPSLGFLDLCSFMFMIALLYNLIFTTGNRNTLGRYLMQIKIVNLDSSSLNYAQAAKRFLGSIFSGGMIFMGYLASFFHDQKLTLHDRLAGTKVVDLS